MSRSDTWEVQIHTTGSAIDSEVASKILNSLLQIAEERQVLLKVVLLNVLVKYFINCNATFTLL